MSKPIIVIGNGGHASVLIEILIAKQREIEGFTAPHEEDSRFNIPYLGMDDVISTYSPTEIELVLGLGTIGISELRKTIFEQFVAKGYTFAKVIHPTAIVSPSVKLGHGVQIMAGAVLQTNGKVADNTIINTGAVIDHDSVIGSHVHIAPGSILSGGVAIGNGCHIGTGTTIIQGIEIGEETVVGAGSVVLRNIGDRKTAYGVPAKEVK